MNTVPTGLIASLSAEKMETMMGEHKRFTKTMTTQGGQARMMTAQSGQVEELNEPKDLCLPTILDD